MKLSFMCNLFALKLGIFCPSDFCLVKEAGFAIT